MEKLHHSPTDWDFLLVAGWVPFTHWSLSTRLYTSPPSCLRLAPWALETEVYALSNLAQAQDLKAGSIISWNRAQAGGVGNPYFYIGVTGPDDRGIALIFPKFTHAWKRDRRDWWQGFDYQNQPATLVITWIWDGFNWINPSLSFHPSLSGAVNRVGIGCTTQSLGSAKFFDDTEIYRGE